jgi:HupE / UreJ protein
VSRVPWRTALVVLLCAAVPAAAHDRTVSYSTWDIDGARVHVTARVTALDVSRLPWAAPAGADLDRRLGAYLAERLTLYADGAPCAVTGDPMRLATTAEQIAFAWDIACPSSRGLQVRTALLLDVAPSHLHLARVHLAGHLTLERVLSDAERTWTIGDAAAPASIGNPFADFLLLGCSHGFTAGAVIFLIGLLLVGGTARDVVRIVIGFTTAYSIALGLAVFGVARPNRAPLDALIGLSIALVAAENLWLAGGRRPVVRWTVAALLVLLAGSSARGHGSVPALTLIGVATSVACYCALAVRVPRPAPLRAAVAFAFGLVHGFGSAAVLAAALPADRPALALFGFNAGVDLIAIAVALVLWASLHLMQRDVDGRLHPAVVEYGSAVILMCGVYWFFSRSYG